MKYGKLFRKFQSEFNGFNNLSANRCSELPYKELRDVAGTLYRAGEKGHIKSDYMRTNRALLAGNVYNALCHRYQ